MTRVAVVALAALSLLSCGPAPKVIGPANNEAEVRAVWERFSKAFQAKDVDGIMANYAPDVIAYDIVPPLAFRGSQAYRKDYEDFLSQYEGNIEDEIREMTIVASEDVALIHGLERISGTLKGGQKSTIWMRATSGLRKIDGKWLIVHDHISVPTDFATGKAALDLKP